MVTNESVHPDRQDPQALRRAATAAVRHSAIWSARGGKVGAHLAMRYACMAARCNALLRKLRERA